MQGPWHCTSKRGTVNNGVTFDERSAFPPLDQQFYRDEHLFVHLRHRMVMLDGQAITLSPMQHRLLALLVEHAGVVVSRASILAQIWGHRPETQPRTVDVHLNLLRRRLGTYADHYLETVIGVGYRFRPAFPPSN